MSTSVSDVKGKSDSESSSPSLSTSQSNVPQTPFLAAFTYLTLSTALTLANKYIFSDDNFNFPWMSLSTQSTVVVISLSIYQLLRDAPVFSKVLFRQILVPCILFASYLFTNARALRHLSLPILSVLKSLAPMGIALSERIIFHEDISLSVALSMVLVILANIMTLFNSPASAALGYLWACCNVIINIAHVLSLRICLSEQFTPVEKTIHANLIAAVLMFPFAIANKEVVPFFIHFLSAPWLFRVIFVLSCGLAAGIGASIFWLVQVTSGSTLSFVGACNKFPVVVLGALLFHVKISFYGWISIFVGVIAGVLFAVAKAQEKSDSPLAHLSKRQRVAAADQATSSDSESENPLTDTQTQSV